MNHFWWRCASCIRDEIELKEKWLRLLCHIINKHKWGNPTKCTKCAHTDLSERDRREIAWLNEGTPAYFGLESVVRVKTLLKYLKNLTKINHTGHLENIVNMVGSVGETSCFQH